jgi:hypothetical protein
MALDILSIPVMAADPKRLFFSVGLTVTNYRNYLLIESIKDLECIKISKVNSQKKYAILEVLEVDESGHIHSMMGLARVQRS